MGDFHCPKCNEPFSREHLRAVLSEPEQVVSNEQIEACITAINDKIHWIEVGYDDAKYILEQSLSAAPEGE